MPSRKNLKPCKQSKTGKRHNKLSGGGQGTSRPARRSSSKKRSSSSASFEFVQSDKVKAINSNSFFDPKIQKLRVDIQKIESRIEELLNTGTQSIKAMEDEKTRVEEYRKLIYNMHNAYKKGDWTPGQNTDTENMKFINSTIDETNRYYENNKRILDERIAENRKLIEKFTVEKAKIDAQIEAIKRE